MHSKTATHMSDGEKAVHFTADKLTHEAESAHRLITRGHHGRSGSSNTRRMELAAMLQSELGGVRLRFDGGPDQLCGGVA